MDFDFNEAQNSFQFLQVQNKLPIKMSHKLELLQECINNQVIDTSVFHSLELEECQALMKLNKQAQKEMFIQIIKGYAYANMIPSAIGEIKGIIDVRTKVLKSWKQKEFKIDSKQRTFEILRKKNSKKKPRIIYLQYYTVQPQEYKDKRYRFVIIANSEGHGYYKTLVCGSDDKALYDKVIQALKTISQFKDHVMRGSILLESNDSNQPRVINNQQSLITTRQDMKLVTQSEIIPQKQNMNIKITKQTFESDLRPNQQSQQQYQQQNLSQNMKQQSNPNQQFLQNDSPAKQQQQLQNIQYQQVQQPVISNLQQQQQQQQYQQQQQQQQQQSIYQQQYYQQQQQQQQQQQFQKNQDEQYRLQQDSLLNQQKIDKQRQQQEQLNYQLLQQEQQQKIQQQSLIQQANETCQNKNELKYPQVFQMLFEEGKFNSDYFSISNKQFTQVYCKDGVQILKDQGNSLCFRSTLTIYNAEIDKVFQCLAEIDFVKKWNAVINPNETKLLNIMQSENCGIIYERHKPYGLLYLPRDFVYLRYVTYRGDDILIVDKSIENEDAPPYMKVIRGEINYQLTEIVNNQNNIIVRIETEITNGGLSSVSQDCAITQWYLSELSHFQQFLKTYSAVQEIIQSPLLQVLKSTKVNKQKEIIIIDQGISSIQQSQQLYQPQQVQYTDINQQQQQTIPQQQQIQIQEGYQPSPVTTPSEFQFKFEQVNQTHQITLDSLPIIATVPETAPLIIENHKEINEIQQYNKDIDDADLSNYTPSDFIQQTLPELSDKEMAQVKQMIKNIEQGSYDYTVNCITHRYVQEPQRAKDEYITQINGGHYFLRQDWKRDMKHGGMIFYNQKKIEAQKRVIKFMLKSIGSNLLSGKSILNISLPVEVFESRSNLERFCYSFTFAPQILEKAAKIDNIIEQMKYTIAFGCSSIIMYMSLEKPFNPILGETYQGFINGCPVYAEQVSHHPPISAFQLKGRGYDIDGHIESAASMHANSVTGKNIGFIRVTYHNTRSKQIFIQCPGVLTGTAFGTRVFNINGRSYTIDLENNLIADMAFNPGSKNVFNKKDLLQDQFIGYLYKVKPGVLNKYKKEGYAKYTGIDFDKDVEQRYFSINGVWNQMVEFDGVKLFDTLEMNPHVMVNHPCPLPSDSNFRLDILYWKLRDFDNSQRTKEIYEIKQRNDRKWREKLTGKKH
ncbi:unnamed protein product [Paramecium pentaurelia]|uniref:START domain-containing protein n=1 Tax=Paramecium pentaurelia TaxID=43138 RepID=A0A8S1W3D0_9CILI|nr:unnamed protein product [Paramecium pentaurelia]